MPGGACMGGRLRAQGYIPDYSKNKKGIFRDYTLRCLEVAMIKAAWLRYQSTGTLWESNPYTDVDILVTRMLDVQTSYEWHIRCCSFKFAGSTIEMTKTDDGDIVLTNTGAQTVIIRDYENMFIDKDLNSVASSGKRMLLAPGSHVDVVVPDKAMVYVLIDGVHRNIVELASGVEL